MTAAGSTSRRLVDVTDLHVHFKTDAGIVKAVDGVSFHIDCGETLAVVGESGSGKSVTSLALMGLLPKPVGRIAGGSIHFEGSNLALCSDARCAAFAGQRLA